MNDIRTYWQFYGSVAIGIVIWWLAYLLMPLTPVEAIKTQTVLFIICCYISLILGFISFNFRDADRTVMAISNHRIVVILLIIIVLSFLLRWYDLFVLRDLSFSNENKVNRILNEDHSSANLIFIMASIMKSVYFFPFVIAVASKIKLKSLTMFGCYLALLLPVVEALLKGTRRPLFEIFAVVLLVIILFRRRQIRKSHLLLLFVAVVTLLTITTSMLFKRERVLLNEKNDMYQVLLEGRYNDLLRPKPFVSDFFESERHADMFKFYAMSGLQTGQYITHGLFEFNHIIDQESLPVTYGSYTFETIPKFLNKTGVTKEIVLENPSPRRIVFLTAFGDWYIDFRWVTLLLLFAFGVIQKYIYKKAEQSVIYKPLFIYFLIINVFLLIFNYIKGSGVYPIIAFIFLMVILKLSEKGLHEKSIDS